jgi:predicted alpha/beta superfamily hydrolase
VLLHYNYQLTKEERQKMRTRTAASFHTSEALTVESKNTGQEYLISVGLPASYDHKPETTFPVIYVLDGNLLFEIVTGISRLMQLGSLLPEAIVVGIGYPLEGFYGDGFQQFFIRRAGDLYAVVDERYEQFAARVSGAESSATKTGGAEPFRKFLTEELATLVESRYRASSEDKTLLGASTGGHFAIYDMLQQPQSFEKYVIGSPALGYGEGALFKLESEYAKQHKDLPIKLFLGIGGEEEHAPFSPAGYLGTIVSVSDFYRFSAILQGRGYEGLQFRKRVFEGFDHADVGGAFAAAGLKFVFAAQEVNLPSE